MCGTHQHAVECMDMELHKNPQSNICGRDVTVSVSRGRSVVEAGGVCLVAILPFCCSNESCWEGQGALQLCDLAELQRMDRLGTLPTSARAYAELDVNSAHTHTHIHTHIHTDTGSVHVNVLFSDAGAK